MSYFFGRGNPLFIPLLIPRLFPLAFLNSLISYVVIRNYTIMLTKAYLMLYDFVKYCTKEFEGMPLEIDNETYYSVNEALAYLGIARDTLYRRVKEGRLKKYTQRAKNRVYFRLADLNALRELHPAEPHEGDQNASNS